MDSGGKYSRNSSGRAGSQLKSITMSSATHGMGDVAYSSKENTKLAFKSMKSKQKQNKVSEADIPPPMFDHEI
jgi:hypothetical protein